MVKIYVRDLKTKTDIESIFLVKYINLVEGKDGKNYINLILGDNSGDIESRVWHNAEEVIARVNKNDFVKVSGKVNFFQNRKQFIVKDMETVDASTIDRNDFVTKSNHDPEKMFKELFKIVEQLDDRYIRQLLISILSDNDIAQRLKLWPAGKSIHHAYQSGLLEHVLSCTQLAVHLSGHYQVNRNYVVAGCILHDLCKVYELSGDMSVEYTDHGKLVGHLVDGVELVNSFAARITSFPEDVLMHLKHILLSHHGELSYGSPKLPHTMEAYLVHLIDLMDSKMNSMAMVIEADTNPGPWTTFIKHLDRMVYKNQLPHYPIENAHPVSNKKTGADLKQNLGSLLKDFKV